MGSSTPDSSAFPTDSNAGHSRNENAAYLEELSAELSRNTAKLAKLSMTAGDSWIDPRELKTEAPAVDAETVRSIIRARRIRARFFSEELFADPAWDMLLDLFQAEIAQLRVPVSSLCSGAAVPATTALRWINTMTKRGLFVRSADPCDGRREFVELAPSTSDAMRRYFAEAGKPLGA